jgi:hypothetical protein
MKANKLINPIRGIKNTSAGSKNNRKIIKAIYK